MGNIGTKEAADRLGVTQRRVVALIRSGRLKAEQIGRTWVIEERSLRAVEVREPGRPRKATTEWPGQASSNAERLAPIPHGAEFTKNRKGERGR